MGRPGVYELWCRAGGDGPDFDRDLFVALMREYGHIEPGDGGAPEGLPCRGSAAAGTEPS